MKSNLGKIILLIFIQLAINASSLDDYNLSQSFLDEENSYPTSAFNYTAILPFMYGLVFFISGFMFSKLNLIKKIKDLLSNP